MIVVIRRISRMIYCFEVFDDIMTHHPSDVAKTPLLCFITLTTNCDYIIKQCDWRNCCYDHWQKLSQWNRVWHCVAGVQFHFFFFVKYIPNVRVRVYAIQPLWHHDHVLSDGLLQRAARNYVTEFCSQWYFLLQWFNRPIRNDISKLHILFGRYI